MRVIDIKLLHTFAGATVVIHEPNFAILGGKFEFNCTVEGGISAAEVESFKWYHNDSVIKVDLQNLRISTVSNQWSSKLVVTAVQRDDGGEYYCEVVFAEMNETSDRRTLQIQGKKRSRTALQITVEP